MERHIYHFNLYDRQNMLMYVELEQLGRNRWNITVDYDEFVIRTPQTDPLDVLQMALDQLKSAQD